MLAIRLQRRGRRGHAQYRVIVQESRLSPKSEKVVANLGSYDPHTKQTTLDTEKAKFYLDNGAQPSNRVIRILMAEKVAIPKWAELDTTGQGKIKNPEKLRKNQPDEPEQPAKAEEKASDDSETAEAKEESAEDATEEKTEEKKDEPAEEKPAEEKPTDDKKEDKPAKEAEAKEEKPADS